MPSSPDLAASQLPQLVARTRAMATDISARVVLDDPAQTPRVQRALARALAVFTEVEEQCTRFDAASPLMRANALPLEWHRLPRWCYEALAAAWSAYQRTGGRFDPRVLSDLVRLGYDRSLPFAAHDVTLPGADGPAGPRGGWSPEFRAASREVRLAEPVDLGGIGKGLAVRWAAAALGRAGTDFLVEAGGDCYCAGRAADGQDWRVGVEDPRDPASLLAVLSVRDRAVATSSTRLRRWSAGGRPVHHLIDPATGEPGGPGLLAVTVVGADPAWAEVWSKTLFLSGAGRIAEQAAELGIAALWVGDDGALRCTADAAEHLQWQR